MKQIIKEEIKVIIIIQAICGVHNLRVKVNYLVEYNSL